MLFTIIFKKKGEEEILDFIDAWTVEEAKEIAFSRYKEDYDIDKLSITITQKEEFDYTDSLTIEILGAPTKEQELNIISDYEELKRKAKKETSRYKVKKCVNCGKIVEYKTKPFKRCIDCRKMFERTRSRKNYLKKIMNKST